MQRPKQLRLGERSSVDLRMDGESQADLLREFALSTKDSRLITGLTYTDANAVLTARGVLAGIAVMFLGLD